MKTTRFPTTREEAIRIIMEETPVLRHRVRTSKKRHQKKAAFRHSRQHHLAVAQPESHCGNEAINAGESCRLFDLPLELRELIYSNVFSSGPISIEHPTKGTKTPNNLRPNLLAVCRAIRHEAGYIFYRYAAFEFTCHRLNFFPVKSWIESLSTQHQQLLSRNDKFVIHICADTTCPTDDRALRPIFRRFGLVVRGREEQKICIDFCLIAEWFLWCAAPLHDNLNFLYKFAGGCTSYQAYMFTLTVVDIFRLPCVQAAKVGDAHKAIVRKGVLQMLAGLDKDWKGGDPYWDSVLTELRPSLRLLLEKW